MTLQGALLEILARGFSQYEELRRLVVSFAPELLTRAAAGRDAQELAARLVADAHQWGREEDLLEALRRFKPALDGMINAQLRQVREVRDIQPAMGGTTTGQPTGQTPSSPGTKPASGKANAGAPLDGDHDETRGDPASPVGVDPQPAPQAASGATHKAPPRPRDLEGDPGASPRPRAPSPPQQLSLGFAAPAAPAAPLDKHRTLAAGTRYLLWVTLSPEEIRGSLSRAAPMQGLAYDDELDVVVFPFRGELSLEGPRLGRFRLAPGGNLIVRAAQSVPAGAPATLYFNVRTPDKAGRAALRVHVYCRGVLLQSHLVTAEVTAQSAPRVEALGRKLDYNLSAQLAASRFTAADGCRVSLFLNDDGHGTHSFRFVATSGGVPEAVGDAHLDGGKLAAAVQYAREALRWAAWGSEDEWDGQRPCKYADRLEPERLPADLIGMALRGANLYMELSAQFSFAGRASDDLREHMREPGRVQLALKESTDAIFPIALVYDYPLDTGLSKHRVCPAAWKALVERRELAAEPCFQGQCPSYDSDDVVCPGGFWGFRHDLGLPLHVRGGEVATEIPRGDKVRAFAAISTDRNFTLRDGHLAALAALGALGALGARGADWLEILSERKACLERIKEPRQLVYFYCHGGRSAKKVPFLKIGDNDSDGITAQTLFNARIRWAEPLRPLVLLNGCYTTEVSAEDLFTMTTAFASHLNAAGVIGTEITNFELIAKLFGEQLLRRFLGGEPLGQCVRLARLELLRLGNPLGLMYLPFALPSLHLA